MTISIGVRSLRFITIVVACAAVVACSGPPVVRNGPEQERVVRRSWSEGAAAIRAAVIDAFGENRSALPDPFNRMMATELRPPYSPDWLETFVDPGDFLKDYKSLDRVARSNDVLLQEPTGDKYWPSEYSSANGPSQFRCGFILHFMSGDSGTTIEAYEHVPTVWVGEHWAWAMHGVGFGRFHDIRFVQPTVQDRIRVLDVISDIVKKRG